MTISRDDLLKIAGVTKPSPAVMANAQSLANVLAGYGQKFGFDLPHRVAQFIAQAAHELAGSNTIGRFGARRRRRNAMTRAPTRATRRRPMAAASSTRAAVLSELTGKANYQAFLSGAGCRGCSRRISSPARCDQYRTRGRAFGGVLLVARRPQSAGRRKQHQQITKRINGGLNRFDDRVHFYVRAALVLLGYEPTDVAGFQKWAQGENCCRPTWRANLRRSMATPGPKLERRCIWRW